MSIERVFSGTTSHSRKTLANVHNSEHLPRLYWLPLNAVSSFQLLPIPLLRFRYLLPSTYVHAIVPDSLPLTRFLCPTLSSCCRDARCTWLLKTLLTDGNREVVLSQTVSQSGERGQGEKLEFLFPAVLPLRPRVLSFLCLSMSFVFFPLFSTPFEICTLENFSSFSTVCVFGIFRNSKSFRGNCFGNDTCFQFVKKRKKTKISSGNNV